METTIEKECKSLTEFANRLCLEVDSSLEMDNIEPKAVQSYSTQKSQVSSPDRPWKIAGGVALAAGVITIISSNSSWGYLLGAGGLASLCVGITKKSSSSDNKHQSTTSPSFSGLDMAEKILGITKVIEKEWKDKVEMSKLEVQRVIESSHADDSLKQTLMGETYYTERINFDASSFVDSLTFATDINSIRCIIKQYRNSLCAKIHSVCAVQIKVYTSIGNRI